MGVWESVPKHLQAGGEKSESFSKCRIQFNAVAFQVANAEKDGGLGTYTASGVIFWQPEMSNRFGLISEYISVMFSPNL